MSSFASSSSNSEFAFQYHVFLIISHPKHELRTYLEENLRDVGMKALIDDQMEEFSMHGMVNCRMVVVVSTPELLDSDIFLRRLVNIRWGQKLVSKEVLTVFRGLSEQQVHEQLQGVDQRRLDALDFDLDSGGFIAEAASLLDSATAISEEASLSDLG